MSDLRLNKKSLCFSGQTAYYTFNSAVCQGPMNFSIFLPKASETQKCPVLFWLSGLTCTEENFMAKAGAQRVANELGLIIVCPDTSPRHANIPGEGDCEHLGLGAGFYVDATQAPWSKNYQMYSFVSKELPKLIDDNFPTVPCAKGIFGHSMGGHGALMVGLKNQDLFKSISAFAPISSPSTSPSGQNAFRVYLGEDQELWKHYDSSFLIAHAQKKMPLLVDQGNSDHLIDTSLRPEKLSDAAQKNDYPLTLRMRPGYDHSYYFVATFIEEHLRYHAEIVKNYC
ncbi:MAG: S-formylglutathione hydrolase [Myxococcales bacterium]|nr:S-formylglutathione hydrolase [Myxococcales bacterium]USN51189.1 MAG: S-formylglutathione hydrolase [Myxococcales bacterium]